MKSFFSKLGVLLLGATFAVVGCTDFAEDIREVNESLKTEIDNNQSTADVSIKALEDAIAALEAKMAAEYATKEAVSQIETSLKNDCLAKFNDLSGKLEAAKNALTSDIATAKQQAIDEAQKAVEEAKTAAQSLVSNLDTKLSGEIALVNSAVAALEKDLDAAEKTLALKADKTYVDDQVIAAKTTLTNEINTVKADLDAAETLLNTVKSDLDKAEVKVDANAASIAQNVADIKKNADAIAAANGLIATAQANITALQGQVSALDTKLAEEVGKLQVKIDANASEITALKTKMEAAEKKIETIIADYLTKADFNAYKKEVADTYASKAELKQAVDGLNTALDNYKKDVAATYATKTELADVKKNLEDADDALAKNLDDFKKAVADTYATKVELAGLKSDLEKAIEDCGAAAQKALDDSVAVVRTLVADVKKALEDQMAADKKELTEKIEKVEDDLTTMVNDLDTKINGRIDSEVLTLNEKIDNSVKVLNETIEDVKAELEQKIADEKKALQDELMAAKEELNKAISKNATDIASLQDSIAAHTAARLALAAKHASDVADLQSQITNHINAYTIKVAALDAEDLAIRKAFADADVALEGKVTEAYKKAIDEAKTAILKQHNEDKKALETSIAALEAADVKLNTRIDSLRTALDTYKTTMEGIVNDLNTDIAQTLTDAKNYADDQISAAETALQANIDQVVIDYKAADDALQGQIDVIDGRLDGIDDSIADIIEDIKGINDSLGDITGRLDGIDGEIDGIQGDIEAIQKDIDSLFNRVQSIVYRPVYKDGKAAMNYASMASKYYGSESVITYKVYPADCAETIVKAFDPNATELVLSYDLINDLKGSTTEELKVLSVTSPKKGEIAVTVQPNNFVNAFYTSADERYAAALVLSRGNDNFSTEYVALKAGDETKYTMELRNNIPASPARSIEYPQIAQEYTILEGIKPVFVTVPVTNDIDTAKFFAMYPQARDLYAEVDPVITQTTDGLFLTDKRTENGEVIVSINPEKVDPANFTSPAQTVEVEYSYKFGSTTLPASDVVSITDFSYTLKTVRNDDAVTYPLELPWTDDTDFDVLKDIEVKFEKGGQLYDETDLVADGYAINVDTLEVKYESTPNDKEGLFELTPIESGKYVPVNVKLAKADNVNKAKSADVGTELKLTYAYDLYTKTETPVKITSVEESAVCKIEKTMFSFDIVVPEIEWTYDHDATADKNGKLCSREFEFAIDESVAATISAAYRTTSPSKEPISVDLDIEDVMNPGNWEGGIEPKYKVNATDYTASATPIAFSAGTDVEDDKIEVKMTEIEWGAYDSENGKEYVASAVYELESAKVTVNLTTATRDRNRAPINIKLPAVEKVYAKNFILTRDVEVSLDLKDSLVVNKNLGAVAAVDDALLSKVLNGATVTDYTTVADATHSYNSATQPSWTGLRFMDAAENPDFSLVTYGFHVNNFKTHLGYATNDVISKNYVYSGSFKTWYGQVVNVSMDFNFKDPAYNYAPVYQYVDYDDVDKKYFVNVLPSYKNGSVDVINNADPITTFNVNAVDMDKAFVVQGEGVDTDNYEASLAALGIYRKFELVDGPYTGISLSGNKINYAGFAKFVPIYGSLSIKNDYGSFTTYYPLDETIFDGVYAETQVRKFDPIGELEVLKKNIDIVVTEAIEYKVCVLNNYSLVDKRGHQLIKYDENMNDFVSGDNNNGFVLQTPEVKADAVYSIEDPIYELEIAEPQEGNVAGITLEKDGYGKFTGVIRIDNTGLLVYTHPVKINVKTTIKYPQTEGKTAEYTITIKKPDTL